MEFLFDTANLSLLEEMVPVYPVTGVTTNPSIIAAEGRIDVYAHLRRIREIIGDDRSLHVQVLATSSDGIVADAHRLAENVDERVYVKIPTTEPGVHAMRVLKGEGLRVTATAVYSRVQGMLAVAAGADYLAPYYNRMESLDIDAQATVASLAVFAARHGSGCRVLVASFKNPAQISAAFDAGAHAVTVGPQMLQAALATADVKQAVGAFGDDWRATFGTDHLP